MPNVGPQGNHRKTLAVKHEDGEPLTRADLQYDLLNFIFNDKHAVFTDPYPTIHGQPAGSKVSREKLLETPEFADEFCKISLLSNVGRINTTMAFFPEMRTALRTYHPVPALQKTDGNLQDAPRIKNLLKFCLLESETENNNQRLADVLTRSRSGHGPPTTIVNLIFIFASHAGIIAQTHFPAQSSFDLLDFFCPINVSSESRARAFLWLLYQYIEPPSTNPFDDEHSRRHPGQIPALVALTPEEASLENVDPPDERAWGELMKEKRRIFMSNKDKPQGDEGGQEPSTKPRRRRGRAKNRSTQASASTAIAMNSSDPVTARDSPPAVNLTPVPQAQDYMDDTDDPHEGPSYRQYRPASREDSPQSSIISHHLGPISTSLPKMSYLDHPLHAPAFTSPYPRRIPSVPSLRRDSSDGRPIRNHSSPRMDRSVRLPPLRYPSDPHLRQSAQTNLPPISQLAPIDRMEPIGYFHQPYTSARLPRSQSLLEHAFQVSMTHDPLDGSEEETDENMRQDLMLRLRIINRLRGKEPTPDPEDPEDREHQSHEYQPYTRH